MTTPPYPPPPPPGNYPPGGPPSPGNQQAGAPSSGGYYPTGGYPPPPPPPGYAQPGGQPGPAGQPADSGPKPAVRRSGPGCLSLSLGSVALLALIIAVVWFAIFGRTSSHAVVGDCVDTTSNQAITKDCGAPTASLKVRSVTQGSSFGWKCADPGTMIKFTQRIRAGRYYRYCLSLNATQGDCFAGDVSKQSSNIHKLSCRNGVYKVTKVFDKGNASLCGTSGPDTAQFWYANPANTYCLQKTG